jgi:hypothetical protein
MFVRRPDNRGKSGIVSRGPLPRCPGRGRFLADWIVFLPRAERKWDFVRHHEVSRDLATLLARPLRWSVIAVAVIGYFDPQRKAYLRLHEKGQAEVLSLTGE